MQIEFVALENDNKILESQIERIQADNKNYYSANKSYLRELEECN